MRRDETFGRFYHFYPRNTAVVGAAARGRVNFMCVAWNVALSFEPPLFGVAISPKRFTHALIQESRQFSVCFLPFEKLDQLHAMGRLSGHDVDKVSALGLTLADGPAGAPPILADAYSALECKLEREESYGDHTLFVGRVSAVRYDERLFRADGTIQIEDVDPVLYLGQYQYVTTRRDSRAVRPARIPGY